MRAKRWVSRSALERRPADPTRPAPRRTGPADRALRLVRVEMVEQAFVQRGPRSGYDGPLELPASWSAIERRQSGALQGGCALGAVTTCSLEGRAPIWQGGVLPQHGARNASTLLYWDAIAWSQRVGARSSDLVGLPDEGIRRFKGQFGGELVRYLVAQQQSRFPTRARLLRRRPISSGADTPTSAPIAVRRSALEAS